MGHVVLTTATGRVELNLDAEQEAVVARFLLGMIVAEPAPCSGSASRPEVVAGPAAASGGDDSPGAGAPPLPVSQHAMSVEKAEAAQVRRPEPGTTVHGSRTMDRLLPRTCKWDGCDVVFQPAKVSQEFCGRRCRKAFHNAKRARPSSAEPGDVACPECDRTFRTHQALGGHMNAHTKDRLAGKGRARQNGAVRSTARDGGRFECACGRRFETSEARGFHQDDEDCRYECGCGKTFASAQAQALHQTRSHLKAKKGARSTARPAQPLAKLSHSDNSTSDIRPNNIRPKVTPADRPFACKEPGCGHPCRSLAELHKHRLAYHDEKHPLPTTTQVIAALSFPCPECGRVYDDGNRLEHHLRVIHDHGRVDPIHEVAVASAAKAVKVG